MKKATPTFPVLHCRNGTPQANTLQVCALYSSFNLQVSDEDVSTPSLELHNGTRISTLPGVIAFFLAKETDVSFLSQIWYWIYFSQNELQPSLYGWLIPTLLKVKTRSTDNEKRSVLQQLERLNNYLSSRTFLVGERLSFADVAVSLVLLPVYEALLDSDTRQANLHLTRWMTTCVNQKNFVTVIGKSRLTSG